ncbi:aminotransferase class V-fold PLP-dependent enzyme [Streptomyces sp. NPDC055025]
MTAADGGARPVAPIVPVAPLVPAVPIATAGSTGSPLTGRAALVDRADFPLVHRRTYLDSASKGALGGPVRTAVARFLDEWDEGGARWDLWLEEMEAARGAFARLVGCAPEQVFVGSSVSSAVAALTTALDYRERPELVLFEDDFPTLGDIALSTRRLGARVRLLSAPDGGRGGTDAALAALSEALTERVAAVVVSGVHHNGRYELPLAEVADMCHAVGSLCVVDGYHQAGVIGVDVTASGVDAWTSGCMKYLLGSAGGFTLTYCGDLLLERARPLAVGWLGAAERFTTARSAVRRRPDAARFDSGLPSLLCASAARAGLEQVLSWDGAAVERHVRALVADAAEALARASGRRTPPPLRSAGAMLCVPVDDIVAVRRSLAEEDVLTGSWLDWLRVSFHAYSDEEDVRRFVEVMERRDLLRHIIPRLGTGS